MARLDGLPLAIELAAAGLRLFPLEELARRLSPAIALLTGGPVDHAARQRTLRDAIAWSDQLLGPADRALLRRLGVFQGGFTLQAAEAVAQGPPVTDLVAGLATLVEGACWGGRWSPARRFWMLETIREYALEQLRAAGEDDAIGGRHARFYAALVEQAEPKLTGADQARWLDQLEAEHANLQATLRWASQTGDTEMALLLAARLWRFWQLRGHFAEGRRWLEDVLAAEVGQHGACQGPDRPCRPLLLAGRLGRGRGRLRPRPGAGQGPGGLVAGAGSPLRTGLHPGLPSGRAAGRSTHRTAVPGHHRRAPRTARDRPGPGHLADDAAVRRGPRRLPPVREQCLAGTRALGERWYESQILRTLALTSTLQGRHQQAEEELRECLDVALELGDLAGVALDLDRLGQPRRWPSDTPNERSSWPARPTAFVSPSAVGSRWSRAGGRPSIHETPPDGSSPTARLTEPGRKDAP